MVGFGLMSRMERPTYIHAFTLIELSIVLVVIGLVVGGILVGRDLIAAADVRAQISQIEKYQQAVNTFRSKYSYVPGDIPEPDASRFGFTPRGSLAGQGDGNGILQANAYVPPDGEGNGGYNVVSNGGGLGGEMGMFWRDLSQVNLVDGSFTIASPTADPISGQLDSYLPKASINANSHIFVWSGGWRLLQCATSGCPYVDPYNYFTIDAGAFDVNFSYAPSMTVAQAYAIDKKVDDGLPQLGRIIAFSPLWGWWAGGGVDLGYYGDNDTHAGTNNYWGPVSTTSDIDAYGTPPQYSCYDGSAGLPERYSVSRYGGRGMNCSLSFRMQ